MKRCRLGAINRKDSRLYRRKIDLRGGTAESVIQHDGYCRPGGRIHWHLNAVRRIMDVTLGSHDFKRLTVTE